MGFFRSFADRHGLGAVKKDHVTATAHTIREVGTGALVGAALGAAHAMMPLGLDFKGKIPIDGALAAAGILGGIGLAGEPLAAASARGVGVAASTIFGFRKAYQFAAAKKAANLALPPEQRIAGDRIQEQNMALQKSAAAKAPALAAHGDFGQEFEDPIVTAARALT